MEKRIIDISVFQKTLDVSKVNADGVIIRLGFTGYGAGNNCAVDAKFEEFYKKLKAAGIPVGCYYFTLAHSIALVDKEFNFIMSKLKGKTFELPIYLDVEAQKNSKEWTQQSKEARTGYVKTLAKRLESEGYYVGIYASKAWLQSGSAYLVPGELLHFDKWVAQYNSKLTYTGLAGMWQYSSSEKGSLHGVGSAKVDISKCFVDYPTVIKNKGLNGFGKTESKPVAVEEPKKEKYYTVVKGDYLIKIGKKTGVDWKLIANINGLKAPYIVKVGQKLILP